jgi:pimeloyl-ACP methyl ester carboxylesterase
MGRCREVKGRRGQLLESFCEGRLFAERIGTGPAEVVALHGWARTREDLIGALTGFNAVAFDLPGFGSSPEPSTAWGSEAYAVLVAEALATLGRPQVVLGHSFGGRVAVRLAARWPELVSGLVLTGVPLFERTSSPAMPYQVVRWANRRGLVPASWMEKARQRYGSDDYLRATGTMRSILVRMVNEHYDEDLARISCPVELVWGEDDTAAPPEFAERACAMLDKAHLQVLEHIGHMTPLAAPGALHDAVGRLLNVSSL